MSNIAFIIPAFNPQESLLTIVTELRSKSDNNIVVVNDGSESKNAQNIFLALSQMSGVVVLSHAVNLGKGYALKTAFNYVITHYPQLIGVVTLDADGQHKADDAVKISEYLLMNPKKAVIGCRQLSDKKLIPFKSWIGNLFSKYLFSFLAGVTIKDTQTGLRGIPRNCLKDLILVKYNRYEFEIEMLLYFVNNGIKIKELDIETIYINNNKASHFNPLLDSFRVHFVLFRFAVSSMTGKFCI